MQSTAFGKFMEFINRVKHMEGKDDSLLINLPPDMEDIIYI